MFIDTAEIYVRSGRGGHGCVSFRREKYIPKGGPDGGDGGKGGCVYATASPGVWTLLDFKGRHHWIAKNGMPGMGKNMSGRGGDDLTLGLPRGTLIYDRETGVLLKDLSEADEPICIVRGGHGGRGNTRFARATHQTPREFEEGEPGEERWLRLELKLIADVGIVGLPNAGKSTLLSRLTKAHPKIAEYPFTTLDPQLGIVELSGHRRFVMADLPGLIEGAHKGAGLGDAFLKHIERTRVILHLVDTGSEFATEAPAEAYRTIRAELAKYSETLANKEEIVAGSKVDLTDGEERTSELSREIGKRVLPISAVSGKGVGALSEVLWNLVSDSAESGPVQVAPSQPPHREEP